MDFANTWILIANSASARILGYQSDDSWKEKTNFIHPESRLKNSDLVSDKEGEVFSRVGKGHHFIDPAISPKEREADLFAKELIHFLHLSYHEGKFSQLFLFAPPHFLGLLRSHMHKEMLSLVRAEFSKDYVHEPLEKILKTLHKQLNLT